MHLHVLFLRLYKYLSYRFRTILKKIIFIFFYWYKLILFDEYELCGYFLSNTGAELSEICHGTYNWIICSVFLLFLFFDMQYSFILWRCYNKKLNNTLHDITVAMFKKYQ